MKGKRMKLGNIIVLELLLCISITQSQQLRYDQHQKPTFATVLPDNEQISLLLSEVISGIRNGQIVRSIRPFSEEISFPSRAQGKTNGILGPLFRIDSISVQITKDKALVRCQLNDERSLNSTNELLTLKRSNGFWKIDGSGLLIDLMADYFFAAAKTTGDSEYVLSSANNMRTPSKKTKDLMTTKPQIDVRSPVAATPSSAMSTVIPSFVISNRALIRRLVPFTNVWSVTRTTTQQNLNRDLFSSPEDGELFVPQGTSDYVAIVLDRAWFRLVYGSLNGEWVNSYGDNQGDYRFQAPIAIDADGIGNIYCINAHTKTIVKLRYNPSTQAIAFVSEVPVVGLINPHDIDIDNNNSPADPNDDTFWVTDYSSNGVVQVSATGQVLGRATRVIDTYSGSVLQFSLPTKILVFYDYGRNISLIDQAKKRVITIYGPSFQGDAISV